MFQSSVVLYRVILFGVSQNTVALKTVSILFAFGFFFLDLLGLDMRQTNCDCFVGFHLQQAV